MTPQSIPHVCDRHEDYSAPATVDIADMGSPADEEDVAAAHAADAAMVSWCWSVCPRPPGPPPRRARMPSTRRVLP